MPLLELRILKIHALTYWAGIFHMTLFYCTKDKVYVSSICVNLCRSFPLFELRVLKIQIPYFLKKCYDILSWKFSYDFVLMYYNSGLSVIHFRRSYAPFGTYNTGNTHSFPHFSLTCFDILSWKLAYGFGLLYYILRLSVDNSPQFLKE